MKKLVSLALLGAFLAAANIGCSDNKPATPKPADSKSEPARTTPPK